MAKQKYRIATILDKIDKALDKIQEFKDGENYSGREDTEIDNLHAALLDAYDALEKYREM